MKFILTILLLTSLSCTAQTINVNNMDELRTLRVVNGKIVRDKPKKIKPVKIDSIALKPAVKIIATKPKTIKKQ